MPPGPQPSEPGLEKTGPKKSKLRTLPDGRPIRSNGAFATPEIAPEILFRVPTGNPLTKTERAAVRSFAAGLNMDAASGRGFNCLVTNDAEVQALNRTFLGHDYPTDVLSFPTNSKHGILGELAISVDTAATQAEEFGHSLIVELQILMLHGVLHLAGFDHERDRGRMAKEENRLRDHYGLPSALIARAHVNQAKTDAKAKSGRRSK